MTHEKEYLKKGNKFEPVETAQATATIEIAKELKKIRTMLEGILK